MANKKMIYKYLVLSCIVLSFIIDAIALPFFDKTIAIHFDASGNVNGEFYKIIVFLLPLLMILILFIKDSFGNKIFLQNDIVLTEPYKAVIGVIAAIVCFIANLYIVIFNLKITSISVYYIVQIVIMLLIILGLSMLINRTVEKRKFNKIILISIISCFIFQIITIFYDFSILNWLSSATLLLGVVFSIIKYRKER